MPQITASDTISDVVLVVPDVHEDPRGRFIETYRRSWFGLGREMLQSNRSDKEAGSVVGLHYHLHQADYWYVTTGRALIVLHDLRIGSPTEGATLEVEIGDENESGVYVPPGVAHGFSSLTNLTLTYMVDSYYNPADELGVAWNDSAIGAHWGIEDPIVSVRDQNNPMRWEIPEALRPRYGLRT